MGSTTTTWTIDEQQMSFIRQIFDLTVHDPVEITLDDIDESGSLSVGQNRTEMELDEETIDILALYMDEGVSIPMPLIWRPSNRVKKVVVLDGNHRIAAALRKREELSCPAMLVTGDTQVAQRLAIVVNTQHGRSTRNADYVATAMRMLREQGVTVAVIARMFGVPDAKVGILTRRDAQLERLRIILPDRRTRVPFHTLDLLDKLEDAHIRILGELFLDAPKVQQEEYVGLLRNTPSAEREAVAHEILGQLREMDRMRRKVKATPSKPATNLMGALQRLVGVTDPARAYFGATDQQKAIMRSNLHAVMPRLQRLWETITQQGSEVA